MKYLIILLAILLSNLAFAQKIDGLVFHTDTTAITPVPLDSTILASVDTTKPKKWSGSGSLGWDVNSVSLFNPRQSEGENLVTLGGITNVAFKYQGKRVLWQNTGSLQVFIVKEGTNNWSKSSDALLWNTQLGFQFRKKWYVAAMIDIQTQVLKTYDGKWIAPNSGSQLTSKFFAPAAIRVVPGLLWKPKSYFSMLISGISNKTIIVNDAFLALQGNLGNTDFSKLSTQIGAELRMEWAKNFENDKIQLRSVLDLYSKYLKNPEDIAVEWLSSLDMQLFNGFSFSMRSDWFYDHNILVKIGGDVNHLGRRVSVKNAFFFKYIKTF